MNLSHGMRQKLSIGIALINEPEILILDEPTTGLDPVARREIWDILVDLKKKNTSLILTTHYMEEAEYLCDYIVIMDKGKRARRGHARGAPRRPHAPGGHLVHRARPARRRGLLPRSRGRSISSGTRTGTGGISHVRDIVTSLPRFLEAVEREKATLLTLECRKMNLDDLFISLTGRHLHE